MESRKREQTVKELNGNHIKPQSKDHVMNHLCGSRCIVAVAAVVVVVVRYNSDTDSIRLWLHLWLADIVYFISFWLPHHRYPHHLLPFLAAPHIKIAFTPE